MPWLAYLRFDDVRTGNDAALVVCSNEQEINEVLQHARAVFGANFRQYATFYSRAMIHPKELPNFPEKLLFREPVEFRKAYPLPDQNQVSG
jgi:hypothetical protein